MVGSSPVIAEAACFGPLVEVAFAFEVAPVEPVPVDCFTSRVDVRVRRRVQWSCGWCRGSSGDLASVLIEEAQAVDGVG